MTARMPLLSLVVCAQGISCMSATMPLTPTYLLYVSHGPQMCSDMAFMERSKMCDIIGIMMMGQSETQLLWLRT